MSERTFDVVVIALGSDTAEEPGAALSRIVGIEREAARRMLCSLPCVALPKLAYAQAESVIASLQLAGLDLTTPEPIRTAVAYVGSLVDELERSDKTTALITLCVGAGMGAAGLIEIA